MTIQSKKRSVQLRSSISEETPGGSAGAHLVQVKSGGQHNTVLILYTSLSYSTLTGIGHNGTGRVGNEGSTVELNEAVVTELLSDTVAGNHGDVVGLQSQREGMSTAE